MKQFLDDISPTPEFVTDERVKITRAVIIDSVTYYEGYIFGMTDETIKGLQVTVGAWTATDKAGTQYEVIFEGLPASEQVLLDINNSRVISSISTTLYFRYYDYGRVFKWYELGGELIYCLTALLDCDSETTVRSRTMDYPARYVEARIAAESACSSNITFNFKNITSGVSQTLTISGGQVEGHQTFTTPIELQPGDTFTITVNTNTANCVNPTIYLRLG